MESKRLSDNNVLKTDPRYRKLEHLIQVGLIHYREGKVKLDTGYAEGSFK